MSDAHTRQAGGPSTHAIARRRDVRLAGVRQHAGLPGIVAREGRDGGAAGGSAERNRSRARPRVRAGAASLLSYTHAEPMTPHPNC